MTQNLKTVLRRSALTLLLSAGLFAHATAARAAARFQKWVADFYQTAAEAGISCVIQPHGSMRDQEVIDAADEHGMVMVFTDMRHFRH